ncbi:hypothetical protein LUZ63_003046 [Rhynchospora breviuscula]|uniref:Uncharacterized protein n=1 Tax=Rhynchospora breviuscula TaxID=2022672 RepID=A0A9Q0D0Z4_9POAL|nr:hypothetical protein LUZ63_003046 [Rhynchospora breviuscula]
MRHSQKSKGGEDEENGLAKLLSSLFIFVFGFLIGLSVYSNFNFNQYHVPKPSSIVPKPIHFVSNCNRDTSTLEDFIKPEKLLHGMKDKELFWRASVVPKMDEFPFERVPKVAFMFLTKGPLHLGPIWEKFFKGHEDLFSIYVHAPPGYRLNVSEDSVFYGRQIPSGEVSWGSITLLDAEKRLLANALLDFQNERFVLISESCIPVFNFQMVYNYLMNSGHSFVDSFDENTPQGRGRYSRHMFPDIRLYQWRKGSQWFEASRKLAVSVVGETRYYEIFKKFCLPSCYPDEHYIPTYVNMFFGEVNANRSVTWVDWSRGGPHPATYGGSDITAGFIRAIRDNGTFCMYNSNPTSVCFLFARKFAPSALQPLLNLSSTVMEF